MKKQYINPTMEVVNLKMESCLMAGSPSLGKSDTEITGSGEILGREDEFDWDNLGF